MLKKLAAEALGISDIGKIISPADYNKVDADDYVMHEDGEKIFFLIKSKTDEYCFTNRALIHLDGQNAVSSKRLLKRYDYYLHPIANVMLETAGTIDLDVEIKFSIGDRGFSIDVDRKQIEALKDLYKALIQIALISKESAHILSTGQSSIQLAAQALGSSRLEGVKLSDELKIMNEYIFNWHVDLKKQYCPKDFGHVFEKYINN